MTQTPIPMRRTVHPNYETENWCPQCALAVAKPILQCPQCHCDIRTYSHGGRGRQKPTLESIIMFSPTPLQIN